MSKYNVNNTTVSNLISWIHAGEIAIPEIQRPFVWKASKVRDLIDSLYNDYPVGYIITWQNPETRLKDGSISRGKKILIDGQQRVTALMAAVAGMEVVDDDYRKKRIMIAFNPIDEKFEVQNPAITKDVRWIPDISTVFSQGFDQFGFMATYCQANPEITMNELNQVIQRLQKINYNSIGIIELSHSLDIETVTEIFIRINSAGVVLSQADFAMSKIASNDMYEGTLIRKTIDYFSNLMKNPGVYNNIVTNDSDFAALPRFQKLKWLKEYHSSVYEPGYTDVLRVAFTYKFRRGKLSDLVSLLSGRDFEARVNREEIAEASFKKLEEAVMDFVDDTNFKRFIMIVKSTGVIHKSLIRSQNALNFAYALFLLLREKGVNGPEINHIVRKWLVFSLLTGRYSGSPESWFEYDIKRFDTHEDPKRYLEQIEAGELSDAYWNHVLVTRLDSSVKSSPYFNLFVMAQIVNKDQAFLSKSITVQHLIEERGDVHHLFPKKYLQKNGFNNRAQYNQIGNYVFTEQVVNLAIKDQSPKDYLGLVKEQCQTGNLKIGEIVDFEELRTNLAMNCVPDSIFSMTAEDYPAFLEERRRMMAQKIKEYYRRL
ncbi:DUF262 domain-containing protein [Pradoshia sp. D12]|uniref:GmrSD restriction endonuclease domain-containing protein n=1 Tax=Bacillaceae TaxID=186817 RepID=UPI00112802FB|nr:MULTISPECIES: DUF262 domain-containing protein [Bacillaceae]QFK71953.1 DUF262 domain-containing protein [Pradoshia sp. D12]TPF71555.1 DUF262 domain-containing protein [Bacillus sp. D12]